MRFGDKLKELRIKNNMSQTELANKIGTSLRTVQFYEANERYPKSPKITNNICNLFNITYEYLFDEKDLFLKEAEESKGYHGKMDAKKLISEINGLYAGGSLNEEDMDKVFKVVTDLYWDAKEKNKKYKKQGR